MIFMDLRISIIFSVGLLLSSCFNDKKTKHENSINSSTIRKGKCIDGKFNGSVIKFDTFGDTLSIEQFKEGILEGKNQYFEHGHPIKEIIYSGGDIGIVKSFYPSGKVKKISSFVLGTNTINSFVQYDRYSNILTDNSNVLLRKKSNDILVIEFYKPYPDEIELKFKGDFKDLKCIDSFTFVPFNKKEISIKMKDNYYRRDIINLVVNKIWRIDEFVRTEHETKIQLNRGESPDQFNIDPIGL